MTAIAATRRTVKELVDGTLRVTVDVEPMYKADFLALMPEVDTPCFIARDVRHEQSVESTTTEKWKDSLLKEYGEPLPEYSGKLGDEMRTLMGLPNAVAFVVPSAPVQHDDAPKPKGGPHSQDAARICKDAEFQAFAASTAKERRQWFTTTGEELAADFMRWNCHIKSRAELDHNPERLQLFHKLMREFNEWRERAA